MWEQLAETNPWLRGRIDRRSADDIVALIYPYDLAKGKGDRLCMPPGIQPSDVIRSVDSGIQPGLKETPPPPDDDKGGKDKEVVTATSTKWYQSLWPLVLLALVVLIALYFYRREQRKRNLAEQTAARERELTQDPVTSGPPIIVGGVQSNETERLIRTLETAAINQYVQMNPGVDRQAVRVERIGPVEDGTIGGEGMVGYADRVRPRRIDPPQPGYRARFRFLDGREDELMSLQGCMNPCYYGEGLSGFTFTARQQVVPMPEPERPAPLPAPHPAIAVRAIRTAAQGEGQTTVTIGGRVLVFDRGVHLNIDDATGAISMEGESFNMTLQLKRRRLQTTRPAAQATGTEDN